MPSLTWSTFQYLSKRFIDNILLFLLEYFLIFFGKKNNASN
jgi:hypothetical protein